MTDPPEQQPPWNTGQQQWPQQPFQQQAYPGQQWQAPPGASPAWQQPSPPHRRKTPVNRGCLAIAGGICALIVVAIIAAALASGGGKPHRRHPDAAAPPSSRPAPTYSAPPSQRYTPAQAQAIESARNYLAMGNGFSRKGLIKQLSSHYGDGFPRKTAVFAVSHLNVNWRHQAVLSAKGYLKLGEGFSCASLTEQLDSSYGDQYMPAQARYAAKAVGLCP